MAPPRARQGSPDGTADTLAESLSGTTAPVADPSAARRAGAWVLPPTEPGTLIELSSDSSQPESSRELTAAKRELTDDEALEEGGPAADEEMPEAATDEEETLPAEAAALPEQSGFPSAGQSEDIGKFEFNDAVSCYSSFGSGALVAAAGPRSKILPGSGPWTRGSPR